MMSESFAESPKVDDGIENDKPKSVKSSPRCHNHISLSAVKYYVETNKYQSGATESDKRTIRKRAKSFRMRDGILYFRDLRADDDLKPPLDRKVLFDTTEHQNAILECHIDNQGNHYGYEKTYAAVNSKYYWVGVCNTVKEFIKDCAWCSSKTTEWRTVKKENDGNGTNPCNESVWSLSLTRDIFNVGSIVKAPAFFWDKVEIRILGPFSSGKNNTASRYVIMCVDLFSFWPEAVVVSEVTSATMTNFLFGLICRYGIMKLLYIRKPKDSSSSDATSPDIGKIRSLLKADLTIAEENISTADDLWKDFEKSLNDLIEKMPEDWECCVDAALLPYRTSRPERAEYTPAYILYGRELALPTSLSHRIGQNFGDIDPHLTSDQVTSTTGKLLDLFQSYSRFLPKLQLSSEQEPLLIYVGGRRPVPEVRIKKLNVNNNDEQSQSKKSTKKSNASTEDIVDSATKKQPKVSTDVTVINTPPGRHRTRLSTGATKRKNVKNLITQGLDANGNEKNLECIFITVDKDFEDNEVNKTPPTKESKSVEEEDEQSGPKKKAVEPASRKKEDVQRRKKIHSVPASFVASDSTSLKDDVLGSRYPDGTFADRNFSNEVDLDEYYHAIWLYKTEKKYPSNCSETLKRVVRRMDPNYKLVDEFLFYKWNGRWRKVIMKAKQRLEVMRKAHVDGEGLHIARKRLVARLAEYYWRGMTLDCEAFVKACPGCPHGNERVNQPTDKSLEEIPDGMPFDDIIQYLNSSSLPEQYSKIKANDLKKLRESFTMVGDELFYSPPEKTDGSNEKPRRVLLMDEEKRSALQDSHTDNDTHHDLKTTFETLKQRFYWYGMLNDTQTFIKNCCVHAADNEGEEHSVKEQQRDKRFSVYKEYFESQKKQLGPLKKRKVSHDNDSIASDVEIIKRALKKISDQAESVGSSTASKCPSENSMSTVSTDEQDASIEERSKLSEGIKIVHVVGNAETSVGDTSNEVMIGENESFFEDDFEMETTAVGSYKDDGESALRGIMTCSDPAVKAAIDSIIQSSSNKTASEVMEILSEKGLSQNEYASVTPEEGSAEDDNTLLCRGKCRICGRYFRGTKRLKAHMYKHTGKKQFKCEECGKCYATNKTKMLHMLQHTGESKWLCDTCGKVFPRKAQLQAHLRVHASGVQRCQWYTCEICGVFVKSELRLQNHMEVVHSKEPSYYKCRVCSASFTVRRSLKRHEKAHLGMKQHVCDFCGKQFLRKEYLTSHIVQHTGEPRPKKPKTAKVEKKGTENGELTDISHDTDFAVSQIPQSQPSPVDQRGIQSSGEEVQDVVFPKTDPDSAVPEQFLVQEEGNRVIFFAVPEDGNPGTTCSGISQTQSVFFDNEGVQYEVECSDGTQLTDADLSAINLLAQASCYQ